MNQLQVAHLVKCIVKMYPFVVADDTYMNIWLATTKHADFNATMERFYRYVSDPKSRHAGRSCREWTRFWIVSGDGEDAPVGSGSQGASGK
ncbi:hypothetical protein NIE88_05095 [Sporolactobacillus shoreicorticis]|uniref:Uncharacterized protein n=1 Tax=Sporolactobacillus shoreicorticis TaxID=1923877 RepID=A0ABW5RZ84_9BACL|nr:hypothetical protein [Sporolactobacillus shoreicorticis]MCO7125149.1 hypothetical protein [Sporolactobacillus shoreicorticis]